MKTRPNLPIIDDVFLQQYDELEIDGQPSILDELIYRFLLHAPSRVESIRPAIKNSDARLLRSEAHGLKNVAGNIGAKCLMTICLDLEKMAEENDLSEAEDAFALLVDEFVLVSHELRRRQS